jgi:hypothetical protein
MMLTPKFLTIASEIEDTFPESKNFTADPR